jgi:hypothetical protein
METIKKQKMGYNETGSFFNHMMGNNSSIPKVGQGATRLYYTDREPYQVVDVSVCGKYAKLEEYEGVWDNTKEGGMGHQNWIYKPTGRFIDIVWYRGSWKIMGKEVVFTKEFMEEADKNGADKFYGIYLRNKYPEKADEIYQGEPYPQKVVEGITREKKVYNKINILFGKMEKYYHWEF